MRLQDYPQPPNTNGIGMHFALDNRPIDFDAFMPILKGMRVKWILFYAGDEIQAKACAAAALSIGAMPIIRAKVKILQRFPWKEAVKAVLEVTGTAPYVQIGNEPGNADEWTNKHYDRGQFVDWWSDAASEVVAAGGLPGLQSMDRQETMDVLRSLPAEVSDKVWFASHSYASNHVPDYPYDVQNQADHPGSTIFDDDTCQLRFMAEAEWCKEALGRYCPVLVTEGGYVMGQSEDGRYPRIDEGMHMMYSVVIFYQFRGVLANGSPLPDYLFCYCPFLLYGADWQAFSWVNFAPSTVEAVKNMLPFVRRFSWDEPAVPVSVEEGVIAEAKKYKWLPINTEAALYQFAQKNGLGYPQTDEIEYTISGDAYIIQTFSGGIVYCKKNDWANCKWAKKPLETK